MMMMMIHCIIKFLNFEIGFVISSLVHPKEGHLQP
jgi:hypothetical protein